MQVYKCDMCGQYFDKKPETIIGKKASYSRDKSYDENNKSFFILFSTKFKNVGGQEYHQSDLCKSCIKEILKEYEKN